MDVAFLPKLYLCLRSTTFIWGVITLIWGFFMGTEDTETQESQLVYWRTKSQKLKSKINYLVKTMEDMKVKITTLETEKRIVQDRFSYQRNQLTDLKRQVSFFEKSMFECEKKISELTARLLETSRLAEVRERQSAEQLKMVIDERNETVTHLISMLDQQQRKQADQLERITETMMGAMIMKVQSSQENPNRHAAPQTLTGNSRVALTYTCTHR